MDTNLAAMAEQLGKLLLAQRLYLTTAESCTGGWLAAAITAVSGSSGWFDRGFVSYSNLSKSQMLGVPATLIQTHGAVSAETAQAMAKGALKQSEAQMSLAITGIAGPDGGSLEKPVGTVYFGLGQFQSSNIIVTTFDKQFTGNRQSIRYQAVEFALEKMIAYLLDSK